MKKRDWILICAILAMAGVLLCAGLVRRGRISVPGARPAETASASAQPAEPAQPDAASGSEAVREAVAAYFEEYDAESYLVVTTANGVHMPIPLSEENELRLTQADGSENVIHIDKNSFYMASSNCDNQVCVHEGEVTLENRDTRVMLNMVICLPHNLKLELLTRAETEALLTELYAHSEAAGALAGAD